MNPQWYKGKSIVQMAEPLPFRYSFQTISFWAISLYTLHHFGTTFGRPQVLQDLFDWIPLKGAVECFSDILSVRLF